MSAPEPAALVDGFGRVHRDLRISVTDRCNFRCTYCMPAEGMDWLPRDGAAHLRGDRPGGPGAASSASASTASASPAASPRCGPTCRCSSRSCAAPRRRPGPHDQRRDAAPRGPRPRGRRPAAASTSRSTRCGADRFAEITRRDELRRGARRHRRGPRGRARPGQGERGRDARRQRRRGRRLRRASVASEGVQVRFIEFMPLDAQQALDQRAGRHPGRDRRAHRRGVPLEAVPGWSGLGAGGPLALPRRGRRDRRDPERHPRLLRARATGCASPPRASCGTACSPPDELDLRALLRGGASDDELAAAISAEVGGQVGRARRSARCTSSAPTKSMSQIGG